MPYDNRNSYPKNARQPASESLGSNRSTDTLPLKERALASLKSVKADMKKLHDDLTEYHKYYMGDKLGNEVKGRSQVVMSDVQDTIESLMPALMNIFYGGRNVLSIRPQGSEDVLKAKLMEEKVNFDIQKGLNGFKLLHNFFKDALFKIGIIKYYWKVEYKYKKRVYPQLSHEDYLVLTSTEFIIDKEKTAVMNPMMPEPLVVDGDASDVPLFPDDQVIHSVEGREVRKISKPFAENIPPEEFLFDYKERDINKAFCAHKRRVHKNFLMKNYGVKQEEIEEIIDRFDSDLEKERMHDLGGLTFVCDDKKGQFVYVYECYFNDYDKNGEEKPLIVTIFGDKVVKVQDNTYERPTFVVGSPVLMPHRICGRGIAELVMEIQKIQTALMRYILDNVYFQNNGMRIVNPFKIDVQSLISENRPGGNVFTKYDTSPSDAIHNIEIPQLPNYVMNIVEHIQTLKENRTGVTRYNQGLDSDSLNKTARGISQIMSAAQQRMELIAKVFAETGIRELYQAFVDMNINFFDASVNIEINKEWQLITPDQIDGNFDVIIDIGSSTGLKETAIQQKLQMLNSYGMIANLAGPNTPMIYNAENLRNIIKSIWEDMGFRNVDQFVAPDGTVMQPPQMPQQGGMDAGAGQQQQGGPPQGAGGQGVTGAPVNQAVYQ